MDLGNQSRQESGKNDILARHVMGKASSFRESKSNVRRRAYIFKSLKHPDEIKLFRQVYGESFYLIGLHSSLEKRKSNLIKKIMNKKTIKGDDAKKKAEYLIKRDQNELIDHGQKLRDSYYLSDVFIDGESDDDMANQLKRFIEILFGHPYRTPNPEEHNMFQAYATSLRSADLSRQVGAVIVNKYGDIIAQGTNDVPKFGGGLYNNADGNDKRDFQLGADSNQVRKNKIKDSFLETLSNESFNTLQKDSVKQALDKSEFNDITEYGRAVHAEMEALLMATRIGISVRGGILYSTTYPCHNCAKHIIASGIIKIIYIEPYPKSLAQELHKDSIIDKHKDDKVSFLPFIGVGPRRYFDLFSLKLSSGREVKRKDTNGYIINFDKVKGDIGLRLSEKSVKYISEEKKAIHIFDEYFKKSKRGES